MQVDVAKLLRFGFRQPSRARSKYGLFIDFRARCANFAASCRPPARRTSASSDGDPPRRAAGSSSVHYVWPIVVPGVARDPVRLPAPPYRARVSCQRCARSQLVDQYGQDDDHPDRRRILPIRIGTRPSTSPLRITSISAAPITAPERSADAAREVGAADHRGRDHPAARSLLARLAGAEPSQPVSRMPAKPALERLHST